LTYNCHSTCKYLLSCVTHIVSIFYCEGETGFSQQMSLLLMQPVHCPCNIIAYAGVYGRV